MIRIASKLALTLALALAPACLTDDPPSTTATAGVEALDEPIDPTTEDRSIRGVPGLQIDPQKPTGFATTAGAPVWLTGIAVAGGDNGYPLYGWPWATETILSQAAASGANYAHFRLGPFRTEKAVAPCDPDEVVPAAFSPYAEAGGLRYQLNTFHEPYWDALQDRVAHAAGAGIYVEIDLIDAWALKGGNRFCKSAWDPTNNANGFELTCAHLRDNVPGDFPIVRAWLEKIADELGHHPNVIFQVGNETELCPGTTGASAAWEADVVQIVRARLAANGAPPHLFSSNGKPHAQVLPQIDYVNVHSATAAELVAGKPTAVNEDDQASTPDRFMRETWEAFSRGTSYHYWFGAGDAPPAVAQTFARLAAFRHFVQGVPFRQYRVLSPGVVGIAGSEWMAFSRTGATIPPIDLGPGVRTFLVEWIDPRTGDVAITTSFTGAGVQTFPPPSQTSWALRVRAGGGGGTCAGAAGTWEDDRFDPLAVGALAGQGCWTGTNVAGAQVVAAPNGGREVRLDPPAGTSTIVTKDVPDQTTGRHRFEVTLRAVDAGGASLAKLEVNNANVGTPYNKLFQLYAGTGLRVNYGPESVPSANVVVEPQLVSGATYRVRIDYDLATGRFDVTVNGVLRAANVQSLQSDRRIAAIAMSAFDAPGRVFVDDVLGLPIAPPPPAGVWELDPFDPLTAGPLHGQNGWFATGASPIVSGGALVIDAPPGQTIQIGKDVPDQTIGRHRLSFRVRADGAAHASLAKLELKSDPATGWDKLAQIYFGTAMRLNHHENGAAAQLGAMQPGQWYAVVLDIDLANHWIDVLVDNVLVAVHVPVRTGPITGLSITGWDLPGAVTLDDLRGEIVP